MDASEERKWKRKVIRIFKTMSLMERDKYLEPKMSTSLSKLIEMFRSEVIITYIRYWNIFVGGTIYIFVIDHPREPEQLWIFRM